MNDVGTAQPVRARHRVRRAATLLVTSAGLLWLVIAAVPGISATADGSVLLAAVLLGAVSALLRPVLASLATLLGWVGVVVVGLVAQAVIFSAALWLAPGITLTGFWPAFWGSWLYALLVGCVGWAFDVNDDEILLQDVLRAAGARPQSLSTTPGVVFIQIDGLPAPLLRWSVQAGDLPTLSRWIRGGGHRMTHWRAQLPATTPASQAGLLHGRSDAVPAFRWYEKETHRLTVTNHPKDAAYVEKGLSDGRGLLADGGVGIGNIFSGDAERALLTISAGRGHGPSRAFASSYMRPYGFMRALLLTFAEMAKELYQGHRQEARDVQPRINRRSSYVALRGLTNVLLRDLNVRLLAEQMMAGTPVMYCDFTDYDEIAHHAGPTRPESLAALVGVDRALAVLERIAAHAPRPYEFVVLSDHGQSQGATFRQRYGEPLEDVVRRLMADHDGAAASTLASTDRTEEWGQTGTLLGEVGAGSGPVAGLSRTVVRKHEQSQPSPTATEPPDLVVTSSGNLAFVYFPRADHRLSYEQLQDRYPGVVDGLVAHDGVGFVVVDSDRHGTVVLGRDGAHYVDERRVEGTDPLQEFGPDAADEVRRHNRLRHVGDIVVNSRIDPDTGEVAAFEELVGCHGGLGGWQSDAVLVYPSQWPAPEELVGADAVHAQLVAWLAALGLRRDAAVAAPAAAPTASTPCA
jgi:uncharacterized membrane protein YvlD (DUF360 family)